MIFETRFVENMGAFSYIFGDLKVIWSKEEEARNKLARTDGPGPVPMGTRQKSWQSS